MLRELLALALVEVNMVSHPMQPMARVVAVEERCSNIASMVALNYIQI